MNLAEKIDKDIITAMKAKDAAKLSTLRMLKSALAYYLIQQKKDKADDADVLTVIGKQAKQRRESLDSFEKAGRQDLAEKEKTELAVLEAYMPAQLSDEDLKAEVQKAILASSAQSLADMGKLMKVLMPAVQGRADGKRIQAVIKTQLS